MSELSLLVDDLRELTLAELYEVVGGGFAVVAAEWINGSGTASASGFATTTSAFASITASFMSQGTGLPHELITQAQVGVP